MQSLKANNWIIAIFLPIFFLIGICFLTTNIINLDVALFLTFSKRMLLKDQLYVDILEPNFPLISYLGMPAVLLGNLFHISEVAIFYVYVIILCISFPLFLCWKLLPRAFPAASPLTRQMFFLSLVFGLMSFFVGNFGQREHLMLALIMPYILVSIIRALGTPINNALPLLIGILAGIGLGLKPLYLILPLSIELYLAFGEKISFRPWRSENLGIIVTLGIYGICCLVWHYYYLKLLPLIFTLYHGLRNVRLLYILLGKECALWLFATIIVLFINLSEPDRKAVRILYIVSTAFLLTAIIQRKGYPYHLYPTFLTLLLFFTFIFFRWVELHPEMFDRIQWERKILPIVFLCVLTMLGLFKSIRNYLIYSKSEYPILMRLAKTYAQGHPIYVFTTRVAYYRIIHQSGTSCRTHYPSLWPMQRIASEHANYSELKALLKLHLAPMDNLERSVVETTFADLRASPPYLLAFDEAVCRWSSGKEPGEFKTFFSQAKGYQELMESYVPFAQVGPYAIFLPKRTFDSLNN